MDIAAIPVNFKLLTDRGMQVAFFTGDFHVAMIGKTRELGISEGDFVYVLGFPLGLIGGERNIVVVRGGTIARIGDTLAGGSQGRLLDAFIFPGNSGSPVVSKTEALVIKGTQPQNA